MPTLKDVAALAGVSAATVSLYLNGKSAGRISQQKQKEIEEALKQLSYQPSSASRQLKELGTSHLIYTVAVYWAADPRSALFRKSYGRDPVISCQKPDDQLQYCDSAHLSQMNCTKKRD